MVSSLVLKNLMTIQRSMDQIAQLSIFYEYFRLLIHTMLSRTLKLPCCGRALFQGCMVWTFLYMYIKWKSSNFTSLYLISGFISPISWVYHQTFLYIWHVCHCIGENSIKNKTNWEFSFTSTNGISFKNNTTFNHILKNKQVSINSTILMTLTFSSRGCEEMSWLMFHTKRIMSPKSLRLTSLFLDIF